MFCPAAGAVITKLLYYRKESVLGFHIPKVRYIVMALLIPLIYLGISYGIFWQISGEGFPLSFGFETIPEWIFGILMSSVLAFGEELGWRGFLLPRMTAAWNVIIAVIASGIIWGVWHMPLMVSGLYQSGTVMGYQLTFFLFETVILTGILAFLRLKSDSLWPAVILHGTHNFLDQAVFGPVTTGADSAYFAGETGFITAIVMGLILVLIVVRTKGTSDWTSGQIK
jgi:membrane protease YdiL (CAAX protease family)